MRLRTAIGAVSALATVCALSLVHPGIVRGDTGTALGDRMGEGSTAFTGLTQAPETDLYTGGLSTTVNIQVPPGRKSMTPSLSLQYSSSAGPSAFGYGWDLPIGRIERSTRWGVPSCTGTHTDDFVLVMPTGTVELVAEASGSNFYRPKLEEAYLRAEKFAGSSDNYWIVRDRAGITYTFGKVEAGDGDADSARVGNSSPMSFLDASTCRFTSIWALTKVSDPNNNTMRVTWTKDNNVLYPNSVDYGGNSGGSATPIDHIYSVRFGTLQHRPVSDRIRSYRYGVESILTKRVRYIYVESSLPSAGTHIRTYELIYRDLPAGGGSANGYQSLLSQVSVTGLPTRSFVYSPSVVGHTAPASVTAPSEATTGSPPVTHLRRSNASEELYQTLLDMNGDGLLDLVRADDSTPTTDAKWAVWWGYVDELTGAFSFRTTASDPTLSTPILWNVPLNYPIRNIEASSGNSRQDTFDMTGDGIPDYVVANDPSVWRVYRGRWTGSQWEFNPDTVSSQWAAPNRQFIRRLSSGDTTQDVVDMNGDGLPDLVFSNVSDTSPPYAWTVHLNTGTAFSSSALTWPAPFNKVSDRQGSGIRHQLLDFNADGLPDVVNAYSSGVHADGGDPRCSTDTHRASCLEVFYNTGSGFEDAPQVIPVPLGSAVQSRYSDTDGPGAVYRDLFDVNGDGLPDFLYHRDDYPPGYENGQWRVLLNLGGTLEALSWAIPLDPYSLVYINGDYEGIPSRVWPGVSDGFRKAGLQTYQDMVDLNGDGLLDRVEAGNGQWTVWRNAASTRPNLLTMIENGLGGTNSIVYTPSTRMYADGDSFPNMGGDGAPDLPFVTWVVTGMLQSDGNHTLAGGCSRGSNAFNPAQNTCIASGHDLVTTFTYEDGRFDADDREFRGFKRVVRTAVEGPSDPSNQTVSYFGQGDLVKGRVLQVDTYAGSAEGGVLVRSEVNGWGTRVAGTGRDQIWLRENARTNYDLILASTPSGLAHYVKTLNDPPDAYGNITHHYTHGYSASQAVHTYTYYAVPLSGAASPAYDRPSRVRIEDPTGILEEKWIYYDSDGANPDGLAGGLVDTGNPARVSSRLTPTVASGPEVRTEYDDYGNIESVIDPNGHATTTIYDAVKLHPVAVRNALNQSVVTITDYRWGLPEAVYDANLAPTRFTYDSAGRRKCVARPGEQIADCPIQYDYEFATGAATMSSVQVSERQDPTVNNPNPPRIWAKGHFDALGRPVYTDRFQVVNGSATSVVRSGERLYQAGGRTRKLYAPHLASSPRIENDATTLDYHLNGSVYIDPLGRVSKTTHSDGYDRFNEYIGLAGATIDEEGTRSEREVDFLGRAIIERVLDSGMTPYSTTQYAFDGVGRLLTTRLNGQLLKQITYDSLGRKTRMVDQNSGTWEYGYDPAGNLVWEEDPRADRHVQSCYDAINRPTLRCPIDAPHGTLDVCAISIPCGHPDEVRYTYDEVHTIGSRPIGRLTTVEDASGTTQILKYDDRGRVRSMEKGLDLVDGSRHASFEYDYDLSDRVTRTVYPDGEEVFTEYDESGQPTALRSALSVYVVDVQYDVFGRAVLLHHGNGVKDTRNYGNWSTRHLLSGLTSEIEASGTTTHHLNLAFLQWNGRGQVKTIYDSRNPSGNLSNSGSFVYDHYGRLTKFDTVDARERDFDYDSMGRLTRQGDRYFEYGSSAKPHQATRVRIGSPTSSTFYDLAYDGNGNRDTKTGGGSADYEYDHADRLREIVANGESVEMVYDYTGRRVATIAGSTNALVTRYYSELAETNSSGHLFKYYFLGGQRIASRKTTNVAWETASLHIPGVWLASSPLSNPSLAVQLTGGAAAAVSASSAAIALLLIALPHSRRRGAGIRIRYGHAVGAALAISVAGFPWPWRLGPEAAWGSKGSGATYRHYHLDHLGSTQVITTENGLIIDEQIRYTPYGEPTRWSVTGAPITGSSNRQRYEFTGYESDISELAYAGARFYDPSTGTYLTHDPVAQFANPYSYAAGDPANLTDPTGAFVQGLIVGFAIGFMIGAFVNEVSGTTGTEAFRSAVIGGITGAVSGGILGPVAEAAGTAAQNAYLAVSLASGAYGAADAFRNGQYAAGAVGVLLLAFGAYQLAKASAGTGATASAAPGAFPSGGSTPIEGPQAGYMCAQRGAIGIEGDVAAFDEAIAFLEHNAEAAEMINDLQAGKWGENRVFALHDVSYSNFDPWTRTIQWNPSYGVGLLGGEFHSPAFVLGHELAHAAFPAPLTILGYWSSHGMYSDWEHYRVIGFWEQRVAPSLGEPTRFTYTGAFRYIGRTAPF